MAADKSFKLKLTRSQLVTLHFAVVNYRSQLLAEIKKPSRDHGPAESAVALGDLDELDKAIPPVPNRQKAGA